MQEMKGIAEYIGSPLFQGKSKSQLFDELIDRVTDWIEGWKTKLLNQTGRTVLIKPVTTTIPTYQMVVFVIPKTINKNLNAMHKGLWWRGKKYSKKILYLKK